MKLTLLYQDDWLVAVNKPSGLLVHRSWLDKAETWAMAHALGQASPEPSTD